MPDSLPVQLQLQDSDFWKAKITAVATVNLSLFLTVHCTNVTVLQLFILNCKFTVFLISESFLQFYSLYLHVLFTVFSNQNYLYQKSTFILGVFFENFCATLRELEIHLYLTAICKADNICNWLQFHHIHCCHSEFCHI